MQLDLLSLDKDAPSIQKISAIMIYLVSERFEGIYSEIFPVITTFVYKLGS